MSRPHGIVPTSPLKDKVAKLKPNVFIAQPRRDASRPLIQVVYETDWVMTPFACRTRYGSTNGLDISTARNQLMHYALNSGAEYIWFVDDDTVVPYYGFQKLYYAAKMLGHPVVGGVVTQKLIDPPLPMTACLKDDRVFIPDLSYADELADVNWLTGFACLMIHVVVLKRMLAENPDEPFCWFQVGADGAVECGEDMWFCHRCFNLDIPIKVHRGVQCRHYDLATMRYWGGHSGSKYYLNKDGKPVLSP